MDTAFEAESFAPFILIMVRETLATVPKYPPVITPCRGTLYQKNSIKIYQCSTAIYE